jgi:nucleoside 2-deoxyribosyltransferase
MEWMAHFERNARLPSPPEQAANLIRLIGDQLSKTGEGYMFDGEADVARVGAFDLKMLTLLRKELEKRGLVQELGPAFGPSGAPSGMLYGLTLEGWERYEAERQGQFAGRYGFIAMKFNDADLELFVEQTVKPAVRKDIGYDLVDLRDVSRAGLIDNIMREKIRDSAFVLVDLTHDNFGAYWEAGYAEGLGKPVVYLCEREKFDQSKTHFDTNHCTTVLWSDNDTDVFCAQLIATLRRSLNLFPAVGTD